MNIKTTRELAGLSQYAVARKAHISRMRISLAECGEIELSVEEQNALRRVLLRALELRALQVRDAVFAIAPQDVECQR